MPIVLFYVFVSSHPSPKPCPFLPLRCATSNSVLLSLQLIYKREFVAIVEIHDESNYMDRNFGPYRLPHGI